MAQYFIESKDRTREVVAAESKQAAAKEANKVFGHGNVAVVLEITGYVDQFGTGDHHG